MSVCSIDGSLVSCDPGNPAFYQNPYPIYDQMRAIGACFFWKEYGIWCVGDHAGVNAILRDRRFGRQMPDTDLVAGAPERLKPFYEFEASSILELEPPEHTRLRRLINRAFVSRKIETLRPKIAALANQLIDGFYSSGTIDLLPNFAEIIPVYVIADMLGISSEHAPQLLSWSHAMVAMYQHNRSRLIEDEAIKATKEFSQYISKVIEKKRKSPTDDLISHLINEQEGGQKLSEQELISTCILLLNAGHEATVHAIGNGVKTLLQEEVDVANLLRDPQNHAAICEEVVRFDPPLHKFTRFVLEDLEFGGRDFKKGAVIGLMLGAANRDPAKFDMPGKLNFERPGLAAANLAFGAGVHFCIGAPLARLEMQIALPILFERLPELRIDGSLNYADRYHFHGLEKLTVSW